MLHAIKETLQEFLAMPLADKFNCKQVAVYIWLGYRMIIVRSELRSMETTHASHYGPTKVRTLNFGSVEDNSIVFKYLVIEMLLITDVTWLKTSNVGPLLVHLLPHHLVKPSTWGLF